MQVWFSHALSALDFLAMWLSNCFSALLVELSEL